jgi:hypothetical protein
MSHLKTPRDRFSRLGDGWWMSAFECDKLSWQRGLAPFAAERPEGCSAQTVPVPFAAKNRCQTPAFAPLAKRESPG